MFIRHRGICPIKNLPFTHQLKNVSETLSTLSAHVSFLYGIALCSSPKRHLQELKSFVVSLEEKFLPKVHTVSSASASDPAVTELLSSFPFLHPASRAHTRTMGQPQSYCSLLEAICPMRATVRLQQSHHCQINSLNHILRGCIKVPCGHGDAPPRSRAMLAVQQTRC